MPLYSPKIPHGLDWDYWGNFARLRVLLGCKIFKLYSEPFIKKKGKKKKEKKKLQEAGRINA
jgi:hypothetical protein